MREIYVRQPDGMFHIDLGSQGFYKSHITPVNSTTLTTWAASLIEATKDVLREGFGLCSDGTPYDLHNWLCDTHVGNVPWNQPDIEKLYREFVKHPEFITTMGAFIAMYGDIHFSTTYDAYITACESN